MLIHLVPRMFACPVNEPLCKILDFESPELGLKLHGQADLIGRRPFPNKRFLVANRRVGRKAMNGFLVETVQPVRAFTTVTRWAVGAERVVKHRIQYRVLDDEMDAVTEDMSYWHAMSEALGGYRARWPQGASGLPSNLQPYMELVQREPSEQISDCLDPEGRIIERSEMIEMHTVERERILGSMSLAADLRMPAVETAFQATI